MTEQQIRVILRKLCSDIDEHTQRAMRAGARGAAPMIVGATLATGVAAIACSSETEQPLYGAPGGYTTTSSGTGGTAQGGYGTAGDSVGGTAQTLYGAPGGFGGAVGGAAMDYGAPGAGGVGGDPLPPYMAPDAIG